MKTKSKTSLKSRHHMALGNLIFSLLVALFLPQLCLSQYQVAPVVQYSFDDDTDLEYNASGDGYDALFVGVGSKPEGLFGKAYKRGNKTYLSSDFPADNSFTLSFWINTPGRRALNLYEVKDYLRVWLDVYQNLIHLENLSTGEKVSLPLLLNEWVPIVVTGDGSTLTLYSGGDGVEVSIGPESPKDKLVRFGNNVNSTYGQFNGLMDEVRVYDEVLVADHIEEISNAETAFDSIPLVVADAGIHHTLFLDSLSNRVTASLSGLNAGEGEVLDRHWSVEEQPDLAPSPQIHSPNSDQTEVTFYQHGEYVLRYTIQGIKGSHSGRCNVLVFEARQSRSPGNFHKNPFTVGTHLPAFRDPVESGAYPQSFVDQYFHEAPPKLVMEGYHDGRFKAPPAAYEHPRLYFNHEELREIRERLHYTESGRKILEQLQLALRGYERAASIPHYFTLTGDTDAGVTFDYDAKHSQLHVNLAFYALIKADSDLAKTVIDAAVHMAEGQLRFIEFNRKDDTPTTINSFLNFQNALGRNALAQVYDYLYIWMTDDQRDLLRSVLAAATHQADAPLMWTIPQGMLTSNFVPWWTANMLTNVTAIEDEDGYDPIVAQEAQLAMSKFYLNGIFKDGSPREGLGKNALGAQALILLAKRGVHAIAYENVYNYVTKFHLHTIHPSGKFFIADDLWGGSRTISPGTKAETAVLKYAYPDDPVVDYVYRCAVRGEEYITEGLGSVHTYSSGIVNCILGLDWSGDRDVHVHQQEALNSEPTSRLFNYTNIAMDRTGWGTNAGYIYFNARVHGGHPTPSRGTFVFHSLGRDWSIYPSGQNRHSDLHSVVTIDGLSASGKFARMMAYDSDNERSIFAADLRTVYQNHALNTFNDYRLYPTGHLYDDLPIQHLPSYHDAYRPLGRLDIEKATNARDVESPLPMSRVVSLVKADRPYMLVLDDYNLDGRPHHYRWQMVLPTDLEVEIVGTDFIATDPATGDYMIVRPLGPEPSKMSVSLISHYSENMPAIRLEKETIGATFEVLILAMKKGEAIPHHIPRLAETLDEMRQVVADEAAQIAETNAADYIRKKAELGVQNPQRIRLANPMPITLEERGTLEPAPSRIGKTYHFDGNSDNILYLDGRSIPSELPSYSLSLWYKRGVTTTGSILANSYRGISLGYVYDQYLNIWADSNNRWLRLSDHPGNQWTLFTVTHDQDNVLSVYMDGELAHSQTTHHREFLRLDSVIGNFNGELDDFQVFDRVLDPAEIRNYYLHNHLIDLREEKDLANDLPYGINAPAIDFNPTAQTTIHSAQLDYRVLRSSHDDTEVRLLWDMNGGGKRVEDWGNSMIVGHPGSGRYLLDSHQLGNLVSGEKYSFRFFIKNKYGERWSDQGEFRTTYSDAYDADGDGWPDAAERLYSSSSESTKSLPNVLIEGKNDSLKMYFPAVKNKKTKLQFSMNLIHWQDLEVREANSSYQYELFSLSPQHRRGFYRSQPVEP